MATFIVYRLSPPDPEGRDAIVLGDRFSPWAALLGPLWLVWQGLWWPAAELILADVVVVAAAPLSIAAAVLAALAVLVGWQATDLRDRALERAGYRLDRVLIAPTRDEALRRALAEGGVAS